MTEAPALPSLLERAQAKCALDPPALDDAIEILSQ
eukprot:gene11596-10057_t